MAVVFMEGFDHLSAAQITGKGWSSNATAVPAGRFAGQAMNTGGAWISHSIPSLSTVFVGFAVYTTGRAAGNALFVLRSTGSIVVGLYMVQDGANYHWTLKNLGGTVLGTGTANVGLNVWQYLELKVVVSATVGTVELRLDGATSPDITASGLNTGTVNVNEIVVGFASAATYYDDIYVVDTSGSAPTNTWLGEVRVYTLIPNGNGANTAWGGTGTGGFGEWDDITAHDDDTTYVSSSTPSDRETSTLTDLPVATSTVFAVQTNLVARKDDAGTRTIAPVVVIGGTPYDGTTTAALSSSYADYTQLYDRLDPSGATWTASTVNAMETGVKEIA